MRRCSRWEPTQIAVYLDGGLTTMPRAGDTLMVTSPARLARSVADAHQLLSQLTARDVTLATGNNVRYPPGEPAGQVLTEVLALAADLLAGGPSPSRGDCEADRRRPADAHEHRVVGLYSTGTYTVAEVGELFSVSRSTGSTAPSDELLAPARLSANHDPDKPPISRSSGARPPGIGPRGYRAAWGVLSV